jgi:polysaccharide biosynthesis transport protein
MYWHDYLALLRRRWLSVLIFTLVTVAVASGATLAMTEKYTATTRLYFTVSGGQSLTEVAQGSSFAEKQMTSLKEVATSWLVLQPVIDQLALNVDAETMAESVTATVPTGTVILEIAVTDPNPAMAARIANAIGAEVTKASSTLSPESSGGADAVRATTVDPAEIPVKSSSPNVPLNVGLGLMAGLILGFGIALLRHVLDTKMRTEQDLRALTEKPILGAVTYDGHVPRHPLILRDEPQSASSEAIRRLRTNLKFISLADGNNSIVISSSIADEGKSTIAVNLALSLADTKARILLVDADLRRPSVAKYFGIEGAVGLTTVLIGRATLADVVQPIGHGTLDVLPAGELPPNPSELLGSSAMAAALDQMTKTYDMVLLDSPPVLPVTDAAVVSSLAAGVLMVVGADRVRRPQLQQALGSLNTAGVNLLGLVMNKINRREAGAYGYNAGYRPASRTPRQAGLDLSWHPVDSRPKLQGTANGHQAKRALPVTSRSPRSANPTQPDR